MCVFVSDVSETVHGIINLLRCGMVQLRCGADGWVRVLSSEQACENNNVQMISVRIVTRKVQVIMAHGSKQALHQRNFNYLLGSDFEPLLRPYHFSSFISFSHPFRTKKGLARFL